MKFKQFFIFKKDEKGKMYSEINSAIPIFLYKTHGLPLEIFMKDINSLDKKEILNLKFQSWKEHIKLYPEDKEQYSKYSKKEIKEIKEILND